MKLPKNLERKCLELAGDSFCRRKTGKRATAAACGWSITITMPVTVVSEANQRGYWADRHRRAKSQAGELIRAMNDAGLSLGQRPAFDRVRVTWCKLGGKKLDSDNLAGAMKALRDCLAGWLGLDDGSDRIEWVYEQRPGGEIGVEVRIETVR